MFRGARAWAKGDVLSAAVSAAHSRRRAAGPSSSQGVPGYDSGSDDGDDDDGGGGGGGGGDWDEDGGGYGGHNKVPHHAAGADDDDADGSGAGSSDPFAALAGSDSVVGVDAVLDAAERFGAGAGGFMRKAEKRLLLAPQIPPTHPPDAKKQKTTTDDNPPDVYAQDVYRGHSSPVVFLDTLPDSASMMSIDVDGNVCLWSAFQGGRGEVVQVELG